MARLLEDHDLLHHFARLFLLAEVSCVDRLDSDVLLSNKLESQVHLAEGPLPEHFLDVVELGGRRWTSACLLVGALDQLFKFGMLALQKIQSVPDRFFCCQVLGLKLVCGPVLRLLQTVLWRKMLVIGRVLLRWLHQLHLVVSDFDFLI